LNGKIIASKREMKSVAQPEFLIGGVLAGVRERTPSHRRSLGIWGKAPSRRKQEESRSQRCAIFAIFQ